MDPKMVLNAESCTRSLKAVAGFRRFREKAVAALKEMSLLFT